MNFSPAGLLKTVKQFYGLLGPGPPASPGRGAKWRPDIDGLRALAVLAVMGFHYFPYRVTGGFVGVDIFFVISGFLIAGIIFDGLGDNTFTFSGFYARRVRRIFPALLLVLSVSLIAGFFILLPGEYKALGKHTAGGAGFIANFLYWGESGYFDAEAAVKPLLHLWSLGIEEQFYLVFPVLLWAIQRSRRRAGTLIVLALAASLAHNLGLEHKDQAADFYSPLSRVWELLAGAALAAAERRPLFWRSLAAKMNYWLGRIFYKNGGGGGERRPGRKFSLNTANFLSALGLGLVLLAVFTFRERGTWPGHWAITPVLGAVLVIAAGGGAFANRWLLAARPVVAVGLISYPLYLWHWPILSYLRIIDGGQPGREARLAAFALALVLAVLSYKFLEKPLRFGPGFRRLKVSILAVLMAALGAAGLGVYMKNGLPERAFMKRFKAMAPMAEQLAEQLEPFRFNSETCSAYAPALLRDASWVCHFDDIGAEGSVAIVGDSHAMAAFPGIFRLGRIYGFNSLLLAYSAYPFALGLEELSHEGEERLRRARLTGAILETLAAKKDIRRVFIITMGWTYARQQRLADGQVCCSRPYDRTCCGRPFGPVDYLEGLKKTVAALAAAGKEVFIFAGVPQLKANIGYHLGGRLSRLGATLPPLSRAEALENRREYLKLVGEIEGVVLIDPTDIFCPAEDAPCLAFDEDGLPLYRDSHHLSTVRGSDFLAEELLKKYLAPGVN